MPFGTKLSLIIITLVLHYICTSTCKKYNVLLIKVVIRVHAYGSVSLSNYNPGMFCADVDFSRYTAAQDARLPE